MSWRGTFLILLLAALTLVIVLLSDGSHTRPANEPLFGNIPDIADKIIVTESGRDLTLLKKNGSWFLQSGIIDRADPSLIRELLQKAGEIAPLDTLKPQDLKGGVSLEALDLKVPKRAITLAADRSKTLFLGIPGPAPAQLYARLNSGRDVYLIPSGIETVAFRSEQEFRDKRLSSLSSDHLAGISFSKGDGLQQLILTNTPQGWNLLSPVSTRADQKAVTVWADTLLSGKIDLWMPPDTDLATCGLDTPSAVMTARAEGEKDPLTITIGSRASESPRNFYVRCSDRPGICVVSAIAPSLEVTTTALRSKQLKPLELDAVDKIEIHQPKGALSPSLVLERKRGGDDWEIMEGGGGTISGKGVREWFEKLRNAESESFETATPGHLQLRGLSNPTVIRLIAHLSENTAEESAGEMLLGEYALGTPSQGVVALREGSNPDLMIMPESLLELTKGPEPRVEIQPSTAKP